MAELKIKADSGGGTVSWKGPATTSGNNPVQLTLPVDDGTANQVLTTNGSGALSWAAPVIADDSIVEAKLDIHAAPSGTDKFLGYTSNGMEWAVPGGGKILQVVNFSYTSLDDITSKTWADTSLTKQITTTAANSSVLALVSMSFAFNRSSASGGFGLKLLRDTTILYQGEDDGTNGLNAMEGIQIDGNNGGLGDCKIDAYGLK